MYTPPAARTAAAAERNRELGAQRALDDPVKLAKAARIMRLALARKLLTIEDLTPSDQAAV